MAYKHWDKVQKRVLDVWQEHAGPPPDPTYDPTTWICPVSAATPPPPTPAAADDDDDDNDPDMGRAEGNAERNAKTGRRHGHRDV